MSDRFVDTNGIRLHYLDNEGEGSVIILMHGLTANAHVFDGLMAAGLGEAGHVLSIDLRGRGGSDQPAEDYTMATHAADIIGFMDALKIDSAIVGGHSFGALLTYYLAANYPERVDRMILIDAAANMHPDTKEMLGPALSRLGKTFASFDDYIEKAKQAPYLTFWDEEMRSYYAADVQQAEDGAVMPVPQLAHMVLAVTGALDEPWLDFIQGTEKPALLINGPGIYTMDAALLPEENARETVDMMQHCRYVKVAGNHQTMLYGQGAGEIVAAIRMFLREG